MPRSLKKGPFVAYHLLKKIDDMNASGKKSTIVTWSRSSTILRNMVGHTIAVYNGKQHVPIFIYDQNILDKLPKHDSRVEFIYKQLTEINQTLKSHGSQLAVYNGTPEAVFTKIISEYDFRG